MTDGRRLAEVEPFSVGYGGETASFAIVASRLGGSVGNTTKEADLEIRILVPDTAGLEFPRMAGLPA